MIDNARHTPFPARAAALACVLASFLAVTWAGAPPGAAAAPRASAGNAKAHARAQAARTRKPRLHCNSKHWRRTHPRLRRRCPRRHPRRPAPPVSATPPAPVPAPAATAPTPQTTWAPPGTPPLSDEAARGLVHATGENRPANTAANEYVPSPEAIAAFRSAHVNDGETTVHWNPFYRYVDGWDGLVHPTTDELIQWVAHKWGIPEDWLRATLANESWWRMSTLSDRSTVSSSWYAAYPAAAQLGGGEVFESMGIAQVKWTPDGSINAGTEPLRWQSTAFNLDYWAATIRYYFDGRCSWCGSGYSAGQEWNSIGAWFNPGPPWMNSRMLEYESTVQHILASRTWAQPGF